MSHTRVIYSVKFTMRWWVKPVAAVYAFYLCVADKEKSEGFVTWLSVRGYKTEIVRSDNA